MRIDPNCALRVSVDSSNSHELRILRSREFLDSLDVESLEPYCKRCAVFRRYGEPPDARPAGHNVTPDKLIWILWLGAVAGTVRWKHSRLGQKPRSKKIRCSEKNPRLFSQGLPKWNSAPADRAFRILKCKLDRSRASQAHYYCGRPVSLLA
jgi:hypothetical protein